MIQGLRVSWSYGISVNNYGAPALSRVTVKDVVLKDWYWGLQYWNVTEGRIERVNASTNSRDGIPLSAVRQLLENC